MSWGCDGIARVWASPFPAGLLQDGTVEPLPGLVLVGWESAKTGVLFQVYVNGRLAGVTGHLKQRLMLAAGEEARVSAIEVVWTEEAESWVDHGGELRGFLGADGDRAVILFARRAAWPLGTAARLYGNEGAGAIDFDRSLAEARVWSGAEEKWGWGCDAFGRGDFGYSGTGAVGWGQGGFGLGEFGFDEEMVALVSNGLAAGRYEFSVRVADERGHEDAGAICVAVVHVDPLPPGCRLSLEQYEAGEGRLVLRVE